MEKTQPNERVRADSLRRRLVKLLSLAAVAMLAMTMLLACGGEDETIGNGTGSGDNGTPTSEPVTTPTGDTGTDGTPTIGTDGTPTSDPGTPTDGDEGIVHPTEADEPILVISYEGGFVPVEYLLKRLPVFVLLSDGTVVTEGPQIEIFPQPTLPNLLAIQISEYGIQEILQAAEEAGLLDGDADYPYDMIADAAYTVFEITANGETYRISAYALAEGEFNAPDMTEKHVEARKKLSEFLAQVTDLRSFLPEEAFVSEEQPYEAERFQTVFLPSDAGSAPQLEEGLEQQEREWPLTTPISEMDGFMMADQGMVCSVAESADADTLRELLAESNQLTLWSDVADTGSATPGADDEAHTYYLTLRPLLPGEEGCQLPPSR